MKKNILLTICAVVLAAFCICGIACAQDPEYPLNPGSSELYFGWNFLYLKIDSKELIHDEKTVVYGCPIGPHTFLLKKPVTQDPRPLLLADFQHKDGR